MKKTEEMVNILSRVRWDRSVHMIHRSGTQTDRYQVVFVDEPTKYEYRSPGMEGNRDGMSEKKKLMKQEQEYQRLSDMSLQKSNALVSAKYNASLLENQIMALALARIEVQYSDESGESSLEAKLYPWELKKLVSDEAHISRDLAVMGKRLPGHTMFLEDGHGNWKAFSMCPNADYQNGVLTIKFNEELKKHILGLETRGFYSVAQLPVLLNVKKAASFRLYELLNKEVYRCRPDVNNGFIDVVYNISELRFMIGVANNDDTRVKNVMSTQGKRIDWDALYNALDRKDKKYEKWYDFSRYILKPAQEELNQTSDIWFEYDCVRVAGKASSVVFHVKRNTPAPNTIEKKKALEETNKIRYKKLLTEWAGHHGITEDDILHLLDLSNNNEEAVRYAMQIADRMGELATIRESAEHYIEIGISIVESAAIGASISDVISLYQNYVDHNGLSAKSINMLLSKAEYQAHKVERAIQMADKASETQPIKNYMGWLIRCIENDWTETVVVEGSSENAEVVVEVIKNVKEERGTLAEKIWKRYKQSQDFYLFERLLADNGVTLEQAEIAYSCEELAQAFVDVKNGRVPSIL